MKNNDLSLTFSNFHHKAKRNKKDFFILHIKHFNMEGLGNLNIFKLSIAYKLAYNGLIRSIRQSKKECRDEHTENLNIDPDEFNLDYNLVNRLSKYVEKANGDWYDRDLNIEEYEPTAITTKQAVQVYKRFNPQNTLNISYMNDGNTYKLSNIQEFIEFLPFFKSGRWFYVPKDLVANARSVSEVLVMALLLNYRPQGGWTLTKLKAHMSDIVNKSKSKFSISEASLLRFLNKYKAIKEEIETEPEQQIDSSIVEESVEKGVKAMREEQHTQATATETAQETESTEQQEQEFYEPQPTDEELVSRAEAEAEEQAAQEFYEYSKEQLVSRAEAMAEDDDEYQPTSEQLVEAVLRIAEEQVIFFDSREKA